MRMPHALTGDLKTLPLRHLPFGRSNNGSRAHKLAVLEYVSSQSHV